MTNELTWDLFKGRTLESLNKLVIVLKDGTLPDFETIAGESSTADSTKLAELKGNLEAIDAMKMPDGTDIPDLMKESMKSGVQGNVAELELAIQNAHKIAVQEWLLSDIFDNWSQTTTTSGATSTNRWNSKDLKLVHFSQGKRSPQRKERMVELKFNPDDAVALALGSAFTKEQWESAKIENSSPNDLHMIVKSDGHWIHIENLGPASSRTDAVNLARKFLNLPMDSQYGVHSTSWQDGAGHIAPPLFEEVESMLFPEEA